MEALLQMNCFPVGMEYFNASDDSQWEVIRQLIDECDYYVLIVAGRYGSIEASTGKSYTQKEYEYAVSRGIPVIAFLHQDPGALPRAKTEQEKESEEKLQAFREIVKGRLCKYWLGSDNLASQVVLSLNSLIKSKPRVGWVKADQLSAESSKEILKLRERIDVLNASIRELEDKSPEGTESLKQGDDKYSILCVSSLPGCADIKVEMSWNRIISYLAPSMILECSEMRLKLLADEMVRRDESMELYRVSGESFQTIIVQMLALGIIKLSDKKHSAKDLNAYWTLTAYGNKLLMRLRALKKGSDNIE